MHSQPLARFDWVETHSRTRSIVASGFIRAKCCQGPRGARCQREPLCDKMTVGSLMMRLCLYLLPSAGDVYLQNCYNYGGTHETQLAPVYSFKAHCHVEMRYTRGIVVGLDHVRRDPSICKCHKAGCCGLHRVLFGIPTINGGTRIIARA